MRFERGEPSLRTWNESISKTSPKRSDYITYKVQKTSPGKTTALGDRSVSSGDGGEYTNPFPYRSKRSKSAGHAWVSEQPPEGSSKCAFITPPIAFVVRDKGPEPEFFVKNKDRIFYGVAQAIKSADRNFINDSKSSEQRTRNPFERESLTSPELLSDGSKCYADRICWGPLPMSLEGSVRNRRYRNTVHLQNVSNEAKYRSESSEVERRMLPKNMPVLEGHQQNLYKYGDDVYRGRGERCDLLAFEEDDKREVNGSSTSDALKIGREKTGKTYGDVFDTRNHWSDISMATNDSVPTRVEHHTGEVYKNDSYGRSPYNRNTTALQDVRMSHPDELCTGLNQPSPNFQTYSPYGELQLTRENILDNVKQILAKQNSFRLRSANGSDEHWLRNKNFSYSPTSNDGSKSDRYVTSIQTMAGKSPYHETIPNRRREESRRQERKHSSSRANRPECESASGPGFEIIIRQKSGERKSLKRATTNRAPSPEQSPASDVPAQTSRWGYETYSKPTTHTRVYGYPNTVSETIGTSRTSKNRTHERSVTSEPDDISRPAWTCTKWSDEPQREPQAVSSHHRWAYETYSDTHLETPDVGMGLIDGYRSYVTRSKHNMEHSSGDVSRRECVSDRTRLVCFEGNVREQNETPSVPTPGRQNDCVRSQWESERLFQSVPLEKEFSRPDYHTKTIRSVYPVSIESGPRSKHRSNTSKSRKSNLTHQDTKVFKYWIPGPPFAGNMETMTNYMSSQNKTQNRFTERHQMNENAPINKPSRPDSKSSGQSDRNIEETLVKTAKSVKGNVQSIFEKLNSLDLPEDSSLLRVAATMKESVQNALGKAVGVGLCESNIKSNTPTENARDVGKHIYEKLMSYRRLSQTEESEDDDIKGRTYQDYKHGRKAYYDSADTDDFEIEISEASYRRQSEHTANPTDKKFYNQKHPLGSRGNFHEMMPSTETTSQRNNFSERNQKEIRAIGQDHKIVHKSKRRRKHDSTYEQVSLHSKRDTSFKHEKNRAPHKAESRTSRHHTIGKAKDSFHRMKTPKSKWRKRRTSGSRTGLRKYDVIIGGHKKATPQTSSLTTTVDPNNSEASPHSPEVDESFISMCPHEHTVLLIPKPPNFRDKDIAKAKPKKRQNLLTPTFLPTRLDPPTPPAEPEEPGRPPTPSKKGMFATKITSKDSSIAAYELPPPIERKPMYSVKVISREIEEKPQIAVDTEKSRTEEGSHNVDSELNTGKTGMFCAKAGFKKTGHKEKPSSDNIKKHKHTDTLERTGETGQSHSLINKGRNMDIDKQISYDINEIQKPRSPKSKKGMSKDKSTSRQGDGLVKPRSPKNKDMFTDKNISREIDRPVKPRSPRNIDIFTDNNIPREIEGSAKQRSPKRKKDIFAEKSIPHETSETMSHRSSKCTDKFTDDSFSHEFNEIINRRSPKSKKNFTEGVLYYGNSENMERRSPKVRKDGHGDKSNFKRTDDDAQEQPTEVSENESVSQEEDQMEESQHVLERKPMFTAKVVSEAVEEYIPPSVKAKIDMQATVDTIRHRRRQVSPTTADREKVGHHADDTLEKPAPLKYESANKDEIMIIKASTAERRKTVSESEPCTYENKIRQKLKTASEAIPKITNYSSCDTAECEKVRRYNEMRPIASHLEPSFVGSDSHEHYQIFQPSTEQNPKPHRKRSRSTNIKRMPSFSTEDSQENLYDTMVPTYIGVNNAGSENESLSITPGSEATDPSKGSNYNEDTFRNRPKIGPGPLAVGASKESKKVRKVGSSKTKSTTHPHRSGSSGDTSVSGIPIYGVSTLQLNVSILKLYEEINKLRLQLEASTDDSTFLHISPPCSEGRITVGNSTTDSDTYSPPGAKFQKLQESTTSASFGSKPDQESSAKDLGPSPEEGNTGLQVSFYTIADTDASEKPGYVKDINAGKMAAENLHATKNPSKKTTPVNEIDSAPTRLTENQIPPQEQTEVMGLGSKPEPNKTYGAGNFAKYESISLEEFAQCYSKCTGSDCGPHSSPDISQRPSYYGALPGCWSHMENTDNPSNRPESPGSAVYYSIHHSYSYRNDTSGPHATPSCCKEQVEYEEFSLNAPWSELTEPASYYSNAQLSFSGHSQSSVTSEKASYFTTEMPKRNHQDQHSDNEESAATPLYFAQFPTKSDFTGQIVSSGSEESTRYYEKPIPDWASDTEPPITENRKDNEDEDYWPNDDLYVTASAEVQHEQLDHKAQRVTSAIHEQILSEVDLIFTSAHSRDLHTESEQGTDEILAPQVKPLSMDGDSSQGISELCSGQTKSQKDKQNQEELHSRNNNMKSSDSDNCAEISKSCGNDERAEKGSSRMLSLNTKHEQKKKISQALHFLNIKIMPSDPDVYSYIMRSPSEDLQTEQNFSEIGSIENGCYQKTTTLEIVQCQNNNTKLADPNLGTNINTILSKVAESENVSDGICSIEDKFHEAGESFNLDALKSCNNNMTPSDPDIATGITNLSSKTAGKGSLSPGPSLPEAATLASKQTVEGLGMSQSSDNVRLYDHSLHQNHNHSQNREDSGLETSGSPESHSFEGQHEPAHSKLQDCGSRIPPVTGDITRTKGSPWISTLPYNPAFFRPPEPLNRYQDPSSPTKKGRLLGVVLTSNEFFPSKLLETGQVNPESCEFSVGHAPKLFARVKDLFFGSTRAQDVPKNPDKEHACPPKPSPPSPGATSEKTELGETSRETVKTSNSMEEMCVGGYIPEGNRVREGKFETIIDCVNDRIGRNYASQQQRAFGPLPPSLCSKDNFIPPSRCSRDPFQDVDVKSPCYDEEPVRPHQAYSYRCKNQNLVIRSYLGIEKSASNSGYLEPEMTYQDAESASRIFRHYTDAIHSKSNQYTMPRDSAKSVLVSQSEPTTENKENKPAASKGIMHMPGFRQESTGRFHFGQRKNKVENEFSSPATFSQEHNHEDGNTIGFHDGASGTNFQNHENDSGRSDLFAKFERLIQLHRPCYVEHCGFRNKNRVAAVGNYETHRSKASNDVTLTQYGPDWQQHGKVVKCGARAEFPDKNTNGFVYEMLQEDHEDDEDLLESSRTKDVMEDELLYLSLDLKDGDCQDKLTTEVVDWEKPDRWVYEGNASANKCLEEWQDVTLQPGSNCNATSTTVESGVDVEGVVEEEEEEEEEDTEENEADDEWEEEGEEEREEEEENAEVGPLDADNGHSESSEEEEERDNWYKLMDDEESDSDCPYHSIDPGRVSTGWSDKESTNNGNGKDENGDEEEDFCDYDYEEVGAAEEDDDG